VLVHHYLQSAVGFFTMADADDFDGVVAGRAVDKAPNTDAQME
jgi:hypothetical protein